MRERDFCCFCLLRGRQLCKRRLLLADGSAEKQDQILQEFQEPYLILVDGLVAAVRPQLRLGLPRVVLITVPVPAPACQA